VTLLCFLNMGFKANSPPCSTTRSTPRYSHLRPMTFSSQSPSPSWRDTLKQSCLERARRTRRDSYMKAKRQERQQSDALALRELIQEELENSGVTVGNAESKKRKDPEELDECFFSEDDLYQLMQEVEEELQRDEERLVEELEEFERYEEQFRKLIADYEDWEVEPTQAVLCPVCKEANLVQEEAVIACPNHGSGDCSLCIEVPSELFSLRDLRDKLGVAFGEHDVSCRGLLEVHVRQPLEYEQPTPPALVAQCHMCQTNMVIM